MSNLSNHLQINPTEKSKFKNDTEVNMNELALMNEHPLVIKSKLASKIGLNEALFLNQINYWIKDDPRVPLHDGKRWHYASYKQWLKDFSFWSESTLKRTIKSLTDLNLIIIEKKDEDKRNRINWYSVNYEEMKKAGLSFEEDVPILLYKKLADQIGINEAIFFQKLQFLLTRKNAVTKDGVNWYYSSYEYWHKSFPFWSATTLKRVIQSVKQLGIIISNKDYNNNGDLVTWYTTNPNKEKTTESSPEPTATPLGHPIPKKTEYIHSKIAQSSCSPTASTLGQNDPLVEQLKDKCELNIIKSSCSPTATPLGHPCTVHTSSSGQNDLGLGPKWTNVYKGEESHQENHINKQQHKLELNREIEIDVSVTEPKEPQEETSTLESHVVRLFSLSGGKVEKNSIRMWCKTFGPDEVEKKMSMALKLPGVKNHAGWIYSALKKGFTETKQIYASNLQIEARSEEIKKKECKPTIAYLKSFWDVKSANEKEHWFNAYKQNNLVLDSVSFEELEKNEAVLGVLLVMLDERGRLRQFNNDSIAQPANDYFLGMSGSPPGLTSMSMPV